LVTELPVDLKLWRSNKEKLRKRLFEDLEIGYLDRDIIDVLLKFFEREESFTISSCSGRITVVDAELPWHRKESTVIFKKHDPITTEEIRRILKQPAVKTLWLVVTGPIIHVSTSSIKEARDILKIARHAGMKHSGIMSMSSKGIIVELKTGIRLTIPLKTDQRKLFKDGDLDEVVSLANKALFEGKERLQRLKKALDGES
jgi:tRNA wybutosine-synthesizing protein 3